MNLAQRLPYFKGVESLAFIRNLAVLQLRDRSHDGTSRELGLELLEATAVALRHGFDPAIGQVPDPTLQAKPAPLPPDEVPKADSLHRPLDEIAPSHARRFLRS